MAQYRKIKEDYKNCILMFRVGGFYQMYYNDAEIASQMLSLKKITRNVGYGVRIPMCGIPEKTVLKHADALARKGYRVAICDQLEGETDSQGVVKREVNQVVVPDGEAIELSALWDAYLESYIFQREEGACSPKTEAVCPRSGPVADMLSELNKLDLSLITPMAALNLLYKWKRKYGCPYDGL